jgi:hypothetical protein
MSGIQKPYLRRQEKIFCNLCECSRQIQAPETLFACDPKFTCNNTSLKDQMRQVIRAILCPLLIQCIFLGFFDPILRAKKRNLRDSSFYKL